MEERKPKSGRLAAFLLGLVLGVAATVFVPRYMEPFLPFTQREILAGFVTEKQFNADRLLLRIQTDRGLVLAVFIGDREKVDLLVEKGNEVELNVDDYQPFLENPVVSRVSVGTARQHSLETSAVEKEERSRTQVDRRSARENESATEWLAFGGTALEDNGAFALARPDGTQVLRIATENVQTGPDGVRVRVNASVELLESSFEPLPPSESPAEISGECEQGQLSCIAELFICSDPPRVLGSCAPSR